MGEDVEAQEFTRDDRKRHREKVRRCLDVFARMLAESPFDFDDPRTGWRSSSTSSTTTASRRCATPRCSTAIADPDFQTELGQFNIEINVAAAARSRATA